MWHVVFAEPGRLPQSRAAKSRDHAIHTACELLSQSFDVRRVLEPNGRSIERAELNEHYDQGKFPGTLMKPPSGSGVGDSSDALPCDPFAGNLHSRAWGCLGTVQFIC